MKFNREQADWLFWFAKFDSLKFKELGARICRCMRNYYKQSMVFCSLINSD